MPKKRRLKKICAPRKHESRRRNLEEIRTGNVHVVTEDNTYMYMYGTSSDVTDHAYNGASSDVTDQAYGTSSDVTDHTYGKSSDDMDDCACVNVSDTMVATKYVPLSPVSNMPVNLTEACAPGFMDFTNSNSPFMYGIAEEIEINTTVGPYEQLRNDLIATVARPYQVNLLCADVQIYEMYHSSNPAVKLCLHIDQEFTARVFVHRIELSSDHDIWTVFPKTFSDIKDIHRLLWKIQSFQVCMGNPDDEFQELTPVGSGISGTSLEDIHAYREGDFGAWHGTLHYSSTIRSVKCGLLVNGKRCRCCATYRRALKQRKQRFEEKENGEKKLTSRGMKHCNFTRQDFIQKIDEQKEKISSLQHEIWQMKKQYGKEFAS